MTNLDRRTMMISSAALLVDVAQAAPLSSEYDLDKQVENFKHAQFDGNADLLNQLCAPELSYSHSDGRIEDKKTFVTNASNGRYVFNKLEFNKLTKQIVGNVAVVRFHWLASQTWKDGKVTDTDMGILMVWLIQDGAWKLLARSATKLG